MKKILVAGIVVLASFFLIISAIDIVSESEGAGEFNGTVSIDPKDPNKLIVKANTTGTVMTDPSSEISKYKTTATSVVIIGFSSVYASAFQDFTNLISVYVDEDLKVLNASAFQGCKKLTTLAPYGSGNVKITDVGNSVFQGCTAITTVSGVVVGSEQAVISLPECQTMGTNVFYQCTALVDVYLPSILSIKDSSLRGCTSLKIIKMPLLSSLPANILYESKAVEKLLFPNVVQIDSSAHLADSKNIKCVDFRSFCGMFPSSCFSSNPGIIKVTIYSGTDPTDGTVVIGPSVSSEGTLKKIPNNLFSGCENLSEVYLPTIIEIGSDCFSKCTSLRNVTLSTDGCDIGYSSFSGCTNLKTVTVEVKSLISSTNGTGSAFNGCSTLTTVGEIESKIDLTGVTFVPATSFKSCSFISDVVLGSGSGSVFIGTEAFMSSGIISFYTSGEVTFQQTSSSVASTQAFRDCTKMTSFKCSGISGNIGNGTFYNTPMTVFSFTGSTNFSGTKEIGDNAFRNSGFSGDYKFSDLMKMGSYSFGSSKINSAIIGNDAIEVIDVGYSAFNTCTELVSVTFNSDVRLGGESSSTDLLFVMYTFSSCSSLEKVVFSQNHKFIGDLGGYCFYNCFKLTSIENSGSTVFSGVTGIGYQCFYGCSVLASKTGVFEFPLVKAVDTNAFQNTSAMVKGVFSSTVMMLNYRSFYYSGFTELTFKADNIDVVDRTGTGSYGIFHSSSSLTTVIIESGSFNQIYGSMFESCTSLRNVGPEGSKGINMPEITTIGARAFYGCSNLETISVGDIKEIGMYTFGSCVKLSSINGNSSYDVVLNVDTILEYSFYNCQGISSVYSDTRIIEIAGRAFWDCNQLNVVTDHAGGTGVDLPGIRSLGPSAFYSCGKIESVAFGSKLTEIGESTFESCTNLKQVILPYYLEKINDKSFYNCTQLKSIVIPEKVTTIGTQAFQSCNALTEIVISSNVTKLGVQSFNINTSGGTGTIFICSKSITVDKDALKISGTRVWSIYTPYADGENEYSLNVTNGTIYHRETINVDLDGDFGDYTNLRISTLDGAKVVLPYSISGMTETSKTFGIATTSTAKGLKVGVSGDVVPLYLGMYSDYKLYTTGIYVDSVSIEINSGEIEGVRFELNGKSSTGSMTISEVRYGDVIKMPMAYLTGYTFDKYTGIQTGDRLPLVPGSEVRLTFYETGFIVGAVAREYALTLSIDGETTDIGVMSGSIISDVVKKAGIIPVRDGYVFAGWLESAGNLDSIVSDDYEMPPRNLVLYAGFIPAKYTVEVSSDIGLFDTVTINVEGPYSIDLGTNGEIIVTDKGSLSSAVKLIPSELVDGKDFGYYIVSSTDMQGLKLDGAGNLSLVSDRYSNLRLRLVMSDTLYTISFDFHGLDSTVKEPNIEIQKASSGEGIIYSDLVKGVKIILPSVKDYVLSEVSVGSSKLSITDGSVTITQDYFVLNDSITVLFTFEQGKYLVKFEFKDDEGHTSQRTGTVEAGSGDAISFSYPPYPKDGYTFEGWACGGFTVSAADIAKGSGIVSFTEDVLQRIGAVSDMTLNFEAQWTPNTYDVVLDLSSGEFKGDEPEVNWVMDKPISGLVEPFRTGYVFVGWALVAGSVGDDARVWVENGTVLSRELLSVFCSDDTLYLEAIWQNDSYQLLFDNNGASGGSNISPIIVTFGDSFTMPDHNTNSKANYTYAGWMVVGDSRLFNDNTSVVLDESLAVIGDSGNGKITFKMNWVSTDYYVTYNLNGGHGVTLANSGPYNIDSDFIPENPTGLVRDGYSFSGWAFTFDAVTAYAFSGKFDSNMAFYAESSTSKTVTLYAVWAQLQYKIEYNLDSGVSGNYSPTKAFYGKTVTISNPSKVGYSFAGWTATGLTSDAQYVAGDGFVVWSDGSVAADSTEFKNLTYVQNGVVKLTATWSKATYRVQYDLNGGTGTISGGSTTGSVGDSFTFPTISSASKVGHEFSGWSTDGIAVLKESIFTSAMAARADENGVVTLKAVWTPISYNVEFRYMEGDTYTSTKGYFGVSLQIGEPERVGYEFIGWTSTDVKSPEALYSPDGVVWYSWPTGSDPADGCYLMSLCTVKNGTVHLTASWKAVDYRIAYSANGGAGTPPTDSKTYKVGDPLELAPITDLEGTWGNKIILGWSTDQTATVPLSLDTFVEGMAEKANLANIVTLYAVWIEGSYVVTVDIGDSKPSMVPSGWEINDDGKYQRDAEYGASVKEIMAEWDNVVLELDGQVFKSWKYSIGTVLTNVEVVAEFEAVSMEIMYILVVGIVAVAVVAFVFTRFERW